MCKLLALRDVTVPDIKVTVIVFSSKELQKLNKFKIDATLQISASKKNYFPPKIILWKCRCFLNFKGTGHYKFCSKGTLPSGVGGLSQTLPIS